MNLVGVEFLRSQIASGDFVAKLVFNQRGAIFFPANQQHRDQQGPGISYADESAGNALAAMVSAGKIEIRNHCNFSSERVALIVATLLTHPELAVLRNFQFTYRGQNLSPRANE